jgi:hypothetical protein
MPGANKPDYYLPVDAPVEEARTGQALRRRFLREQDETLSENLDIWEDDELAERIVNGLKQLEKTLPEYR